MIIITHIKKKKGQNNDTPEDDVTEPIRTALDALGRIKASAIENHGRLAPSAILDIQAAINSLSVAEQGTPTFHEWMESLRGGASVTAGTTDRAEPAQPATQDDAGSAELAALNALDNVPDASHQRVPEDGWKHIRRDKAKTAVHAALRAALPARSDEGLRTAAESVVRHWNKAIPASTDLHYAVLDLRAALAAADSPVPAPELDVERLAWALHRWSEHDVDLMTCACRERATDLAAVYAALGDAPKDNG